MYHTFKLNLLKLESWLTQNYEVIRYQQPCCKAALDIVYKCCSILLAPGTKEPNVRTNPMGGTTPCLLNCKIHLNPCGSNSNTKGCPPPNSKYIFN